jgi:hypothetical protein
MKHFFLFAFLFATSFSFSQFLDDGDYLLTDGDLYQVRLSICEDGYVVCYFQFLHDENTIALIERGEWFEVNPNGADPEYDGPMGWYQMHTPEEEYFELEVMESGGYKLVFGENSIELYEAGGPDSGE